MGKYEDYCITEIVEKVNVRYFLPHIQRPFVWQEDKILRLFDSLLRGYPIGTFLFWNLEKLRSKVDIRKRKFITNYYKEYARNFNIERLGLEDTSTNDKITLVLDGQQRIQSLFISLCGKYEDKELFFNILSGKEENEEGILYEFDFLKETSKKKNGHWIKVKDLLERFKNSKTTVASVRKEIISQIENFKIEDEDLIEKNLEYLKNALVVKNPGTLSVYEEDEESEEGIFDIFVRVNSGGTPLGKSDLLFSFIKLTWKDFEAEKEFPGLLDKINGNEQFRFDVEFLLKASLMLTGEYVRFSSKTFSGEKGKDISRNIEQNWGRIAESITNIVDLVRDQFKITNEKLLSSAVSLIPIIYYAYVHKKDSLHKLQVDSEDLERIRVWLLNILLSKSFSGSSDALLETTRKSFIDKISPKFKEHLEQGVVNDALLAELNKKQSVISQGAEIKSLGGGRWDIKDGKNIYFIEEDTKNLLFYERILDNTADDMFPVEKVNRELKRAGRMTEIQQEMMRNTGYRSPESYLLLYLIYPYAIEFKPSNDRNLPQQDHIFSRHELTDAGRSDGDINRIGNIRMVSRDENCWYKSDMLFGEFIANSKLEDLRMHLIPEYGETGSENFNWSVEKYDEFVLAREELIMKKIKAKL